jgi:hypothetical protein
MQEDTTLYGMRRTSHKKGAIEASNFYSEGNYPCFAVGIIEKAAVRHDNFL